MPNTRIVNSLSPDRIEVDSSQPVRVGFVMHLMQVAGAEVLVKQIIERLPGVIDATVFCLDGVGELGEQLLDAGVPVVVLGRKPGMDWEVAQRLAAETKTRKIEVLHAHQYTPFFYSALARLRYRAKAKIIFTEHGRHYPDVVSWKRRIANQLCLQRYAGVTTACCDFSTNALRKIDGFSKAFTLRNGVDLQSLPPRGGGVEQTELRRSLGLDIDRPYAACIARFHEVKDHATLIRAWAHVHNIVPQARLLLVGDGPERGSIEEQIKSLANRSDGNGSANVNAFSESIEFWGVRSDVPKILRAIDVFTLTSVSEAASLTLLEAMASGCASVVTEVGGNAEHLRESMDGYLVPRGDDQKLADRLAKLLSQPAMRDAFGESARSQIAERFLLDNAIASYATHYLKLAGRTQTSAHFTSLGVSSQNQQESVIDRATTSDCLEGAQ